MKDIKPLETMLGITFKDRALLTQAFLHRSYLNEHAGLGMQHNERLEFLGDAVLELVVTDALFAKFPDNPEGELTAYRSSLVNTNSLAEVARGLSFEDYLLLSRGESRDTGKARTIILANTFESFLGALYLDQGIDAARKFVAAHLLPRLDEIIEKSLWRDAKSFVQERAQEVMGTTPLYKVMRETGPDHDKKFVSGIYFGKDLIAEGTGSSKQEAEQEAARLALQKKGWK
jgi:ribonuclease-3